MFTCIFTISQFTVTAQSEQELFMSTEHSCNGPSTCEWVLYVWMGLQLTSASPHVNGAIAQGNAIKHEIHISISTYHAIHRQALSYTMPCPSDHTIYHTTSPGHTIYHARYGMGIIYPNSMSSPPGDTMPYLVRPYHMPCLAGHIIDHAMPTRPYHIPCHTSPGHMIYYVMPARPYHIPRHTPPDNNIYHATPCQANTYTMRCPPGHTIYHAMPTRLYHTPCHTSPGHTIYYVMPNRAYHIPWHTPPDNNMYHATPCQANTHTMRCPPDHNIYHAMPLNHAIYHAMLLNHAMPARPYHIHVIPPGQTIHHPIPRQAIPCHAPKAIPYILPCPPGHISCIALQAIPYTMPYPADHTIYYVISARPYHIPCHVGGWSGIERNGKGPTGLVIRCMIVMSIVKKADSFLWKLLLVIHKRSMVQCGSVLDSLPCFSQPLRLPYPTRQ